MAQLAQAYIHFRPYSASSKRIRELGAYAESLSAEVASGVYGGDVSVAIEIEEGSLRTRMTVIGSIGGLLLSVYGFVANYKGFKEGLVAMCDDAQNFAVDVCAPFAWRAKVDQSEIYRFERRLKTPGKIYRITKRLDRLQRSVSDLGPRDVEKELGALRHDLDLIAADLTADEIALIEKNLRRKNLPRPSKWPPATQPKLAIVRDEQTEFFDSMTISTVPPSRRLVFRSTVDVPKTLKLPRPERLVGTTLLPYENSREDDL